MAGVKRWTRCGLGAMLVCLAFAGAVLAELSESAVEIAYDDGTSEAGRGYDAAGSGLAVRFTPAQTGDMLLRVSLYFSGLWGNPAPIEVHVWDAERKDMIEPLLATPLAEGWFDVDLSAAQVVLEGDIYVGYLQTSAENHPWLGIDTTSASDRSYGVPAWVAILPEGACAMIRVLTQRPVEVEVGLELAYDDGVAEAARGYAIAGAGYAVRFTPPAGGATLRGARLYVSGIAGNPAPIEVHVWDTESRDLVPPRDALPTETGWFEVDFAGAALRVDTDFSIGYLQTDAEDYPWLGIDLGTAAGRSYSVPDWNQLLPSGANAMIRAIFAAQ